MIRKIHILGASGSGTTTLGKAIAAELGYYHFDTDDFFWQTTNPPFTAKRNPAERLKLIKNVTYECNCWVLTGSLTGWGDFLINQFDLVIFLYLEPEIRLTRLMKREEDRYGKARISAGGDMHENYIAFIGWASKYDNSGIEMRSLALHEKWLEQLICPILRIEKNIETPDKLQLVKETIRNLNLKQDNHA